MATPIYFCDPKDVKPDEIMWNDTLLHNAEQEILNAPRSCKAAMRSVDKHKWNEACHKEMNALQMNGTFRFTKLRKGRRALGTKWVFTIKDSGLYKARLVALGNFQKEGIDYTTTFSPVIRYTCLRILLAIAARYNLTIRTNGCHDCVLKWNFLRRDLYQTA